MNWLEKNSEILYKDKLLNILNLFNTSQEHHKYPIIMKTKMN